MDGDSPPCKEILFITPATYGHGMTTRDQQEIVIINQPSHPGDFPHPPQHRLQTAVLQPVVSKCECKRVGETLVSAVQSRGPRVAA